MSRTHKLNTFKKGTKAYMDRITSQQALYKKLLELADKDTNEQVVYYITDKKLLYKVLQLFGPALDHTKADFPLETIYEAGIHKATGSLLINNKGATLFCLSSRTKTPYITHHLGFLVYTPGMGVECVNVGLVGNVYGDSVVLRTESACSPSFLFNSQRCNCHHQWESCNELAAYFHAVTPSTDKEGTAFEYWVQEQITRGERKYLHHSPHTGFILMHVDTQNGMGSGYTADEFAFDLYTRASLRHRGEYSSEQIHKTSMAGGFTAIGIKPDPRSEDNNLGYKVTPIILDYLQTSKHVIFLSNNLNKISVLKGFGYDVTRVKSLGAINVAGAKEARERGSDFGHLDISEKSVSFEEEYERLKKELEVHIERKERNYGTG